VSSHPTPRRFAGLARIAAAAALIAPLSACSILNPPDLVIYNAQHEELLDELVPLFEEESGLNVELRPGKDLELANQIVEEGEDSPADVFLTENSPAMSIVDNAGLFAPAPAGALENIPAEYVPSSRNWVGFLGRSTVVMYNTDNLTEADLPASILDFAEPEWQGRVGFSPTGADFQAIVSAVLELEGEEATRTWLEGLKANGVILQNNLVVMQSANAGEIDAGIAYHYYWYRDREESGSDSDSSALHFFGDQDPGAFLSVSGAGILKSSEHPEAAEEFVDWLTGTEAQQAMAESYALEYPLNPEASLNPDVKPFDELEPPTVDVSSLNGPQVTELMTEAGLL
jgi:iron(III) transport system substrate-binding protein